MTSGGLIRTEYRVQYKTYAESGDWVDDASHDDYSEIRNRCNSLYGMSGIAAVRVLLVSTVLYKEIIK
jgi:hypothetical protein